MDQTASKFLQRLGVRNAPAVEHIMETIVQDFAKQISDHDGMSYIIPPALNFLARHVEEYYPELWKQKPSKPLLLPARWPENPREHSSSEYANKIVLLPMEKIFKSERTF